MEDTCPHCNHPWNGHGYFNYPAFCDCGCMWPNPNMPAPPEPQPPSELAQRLSDAFWEAAKNHDDPFFYANASMDDVDGELTQAFWEHMAAAFEKYQPRARV